MAVCALDVVVLGGKLIDLPFIVVLFRLNVLEATRDLFAHRTL